MDAAHRLQEQRAGVRIHERDLDGRCVPALSRELRGDRSRSAALQRRADDEADAAANDRTVRQRQGASHELSEQCLRNDALCARTNGQVRIVAWIVIIICASVSACFVVAIEH